jgi:radical SAM superfamily enzyme YgiQ (UPF0313 family)
MLIRATINCPWNRCEFCSVFKGQKFRLRPVEEVKEDILAARAFADAILAQSAQAGERASVVARLNGVLWIEDDGVKSAFLQDSDSMIMKTDPLVEILEFLHETFPTLERVTTYARGKTVYHKTPQELKRIREAGLTRLHIGLETGDDDLLAYIQKGATADQMIQAGRKGVEAGFEVSEYIMPGLGGWERWEQHARNSASVLNQINPHFIRLRTFHPIPGTPMYEKAEREEYHLQSIEGVLIEIREFIEALEVTSELVTSDFAPNYFMQGIDGKLPEDRERLLRSVDDAIAYWRARGEPKRNPFMRGFPRPIRE